MIRTFSDRMLAWYDQHARTLPWRVGPKQKQTGTKPDPYYVWLSEIMLQQTTVATVKPYFRKFLSIWPTVHTLANANINDIMREWAGLGYYSRARNLYSAARQVQDQYGGAFPSTESALRKLAGVGEYTAAAIAAIAYDQRAVVVDGNVNRVIVRHENLRQPVADIKPLIRTHAEARTPAQQPGDYAQAIMDLGAMICTPTKPKCLLCPVHEDCKALAHGDPDALPAKKQVPRKPVRRGVVKVMLSTDGMVLVKTNPNRGLLGGMVMFPHSAWIDVAEAAGNAKTVFSDWDHFVGDNPIEGLAMGGEPMGQVHHTFTHFHLILWVVKVEPVERMVKSNQFFWHPIKQIDDLALPTLMKKVWQCAMLD